jgi:hypothetical protein
VSLLLWSALAWANPVEWSLGEAPSWVVAQPIPRTEQTGAGEGGAVDLLLDDEQVQAAAHRETHFYRTVLRVTSVAGIQDYSEISYGFDPSYESLVLHHIVVRRGDTKIDAMRPDELRLVHLERDMDLRIYNGEQEVLAFLNDVRVGDVIDTAWSVSGANPALEGHYVDAFGFDQELPVARVHRRLTWTGERPLQVRRHAGAPVAQREVDGDQTVYTWSIDEVAAGAWDGWAPGWVAQRPWIQVSDFEQWSDVVDWALPHFQPGPMSDPLRQAILEWSALPDPVGRLSAALAFVQDDVRYLGIEMGPRGLIPHGVSETFGRRFGDCKDKSLLLVAVLRDLGIEAHVALVHTQRKSGIQTFAPTAYAFNHAIVRVRLGAETLWLDPTRSYERGPPASMAPVDVGLALVLEPGGDGLTEMPLVPPVQPQVETRERFSLSSLYGPVTLNVETVYRGRHASGMRRQLESALAADVRNSRMQAYARQYPGVERIQDLQVDDDRLTGELRVVESYRFSSLWREGAFGLVGRASLRGLTEAPSASRALPLEMAHPVMRRHVVELELPVDFVLRSGSDQVITSSFEYVAKRSYDEGVLRLDTVYRSVRDHVPAAEVEDHREAVEAAEKLGVFWVFDGQVDPGWDRITVGAVVGTGFVLLLFVAAPLRSAGSRWRARRAFRARLMGQKPDSPNQALWVTDSVQANQGLKSMRCTCGAPLDQGVPISKNIRHEGAHLLVLETGCSACSLRTTAYFRFRT